MDGEDSVVGQRFAHLMAPIKELQKNWDVDLTDILEHYITELDALRVRYSEGGDSNINFAEAATLLQGSSNIWAKKIEFLYGRVQELQNMISNQKKAEAKKGKNRNEDGDGNDGGGDDDRNEDDEDLMNLDNIKESGAITLPTPTNRTPQEDAFLMPPMPISLIPMEDFEKSDVPLISRSGKLLGKKDDFRMNTCYVHKSGVLLLDHANADLISENPETTLFLPSEDRKSSEGPRKSMGLGCISPDLADFPPIGSPGAAEASACGGMEMGGFDDPETTAVEVQREAGMTMLDIPGPSAEGEARGSTSMLKAQRRSGRSASRFTDMGDHTVQPKVDPWELTDPYEISIKAPSKPCKALKCCVVPKTLEKREIRKREKEGGTAAQGTSTYIKQEFYSYENRLPKNPCKILLWPALESKYYERIKAERQSRVPRRKIKDTRLRQRRGASSDGEAEEELVLEKAGPALEEQIAAAEIGGFNDDGEDNWEEEIMGGFDNDEPAGPGDDPDFGYPVTSTGDEGLWGEEGTSRPRSDMGYEELVKQGVSKYLRAAQRHMVTNDLTKRVQAWEDRIGPALLEEEKRPEFDIHVYGKEILEKLGEVGRQKHFVDFVSGRPKWEVSRYFLSSLIMANTYNVEVSNAPTDLPHPVDTMNLKLLSKTRHHEQGQ